MECPDAPAERPRPAPGQALSRSLVALDQDSTIITVVELSQLSWLVAGVLPGIERQPCKKLEPSPERLLALLIIEKGLAAVQTSIRLDPRDPFSAIRLLHIACGLYFSREYEEAIEAAKQLIRSYPDFPMIYRWPAAALGQLGRTAEAKGALDRAVSLAPAEFDMHVRNRVPWFRPEDHAHLVEGLRKAGWEG